MFETNSKSLILTSFFGFDTRQIVDYIRAKVVAINIDMLNVAFGRVTFLGCFEVGLHNWINKTEISTFDLS